MKREIRHFDMEEVEIRAKEDGGESRTITGYAARFEKLSVDLGGFREKIKRGTFARSLKSENIRALWNHNSDIVLGSTKAGTLRLYEDDKGLRFDFDAPASSWGDTALESIKRGDVDSMSFGFRVRNDTWEENGKEVIRTLEDVDLFEISPTAFPAYPSSSASARSAEEVLTEYRSGTQNRSTEIDNPIYSMDDNVKVKGTPHMPEQDTGKIAIIKTTNVYGIIFDSMPEMGVHKWYIEDEIEPSAADDNTVEKMNRAEELKARNAEAQIRARLIILGGDWT